MVLFFYFYVFLSIVGCQAPQDHRPRETRRYGAG